MITAAIDGAVASLVAGDAEAAVRVAMGRGVAELMADLGVW